MSRSSMTTTGRYRARKDGLNNLLERITYWALLALVFGLPLVMIPGQVDGFQLPKATLLWVGSTILLSLHLVRLSLFREKPVERSDMSYLILAFLVLVILSTLRSVDFLTSALGNYERYEGAITYFSYIVLFFTGAKIFAAFDRKISFAKALAVAAAIASLYGILQYVGFDFFNWAPEFAERNRSFSTFGNSEMFAGFLVLALFAGFSLYLTSKRAAVLWGASTVLIFANILTSFSRGGWLATVTGLVVLFLVAGVKQRMRSFVVIVFLMLAVVLAVEIFPPSARTSTERLGAGAVSARAVSALDVRQSSVARRLEIWKSSLAGLRERPVLGYGLDAFLFMFQKFETVEYVRQPGSLRSITDNAHNYFLQLAVTVGVPGAIVFAALLAVFLRKSIASLRLAGSIEERILMGGLVAATVAYSVHLQFAVSAVGSMPLFWAILGLASATSKPLPRRQSGPSENVSWWRFLLSFLLLLGALFIASWFLNFQRADLRFSRAQRLSQTGDFGRAFWEYRAAIRLNPYRARYRGEFGLFFFNQWEQRGEKRLFLEAVRYLQEAKRTSPLEVDNYILLANSYRYGGLKIDPKYFRSSLREASQALRLEPNSARARNIAGFVLLMMGKRGEAYRQFERVLKLNPNYPPLYNNLGLYYLKAGRFKEARQMYEKALQLDPLNLEARRVLESDL